MTKKRKYAVAAVVLVVILSLIVICYNIAPGVRAFVNIERGYLLEAHYATDYETLRQIEDTCRSMISSYESDRMTYELYRNSSSDEKQGWAEQARIRANKTASTYNNYILKNRHIWKNAVPYDICAQLDYLE